MNQSTIDAARNGDEDAWRILYEDTAPRVRAYFRARRVTDPDDLVGAVFLDAARGIGRFSGDADGFRGWLFTIAHRRWVDEVRRAGRRPEAPVHRVPDAPAADEVEHEALGAIAGEGLLRYVDGLPPAQRSVVLLRVLGGLTNPEIAAALGVSAVSVKVNYHRGVKALRGALAEAFDDDDDGILIGGSR